VTPIGHAPAYLGVLMPLAGLMLLIWWMVN